MKGVLAGTGCCSVGLSGSQPTESASSAGLTERENLTHPESDEVSPPVRLSHEVGGLTGTSSLAVPPSAQSGLRRPWRAERPAGRSLERLSSAASEQTEMVQGASAEAPWSRASNTAAASANDPGGGS